MTSIFAQALAGGPNPFAASVSPSPVLPAAPQVANESAVSEPAAIEPVHPTPVSPEVDEGAKDGYDQKSSKYFNNKRFSDLKIKFGDREFHAHRFVLCEKSPYFDKLCGPDSPFVEANEKELTLHDDDPDAVWAMVRHLYQFWLRPPRLDLDIEDKVDFYCNVIVVSDKYNIPALADEARKSLNTFLISLEKPQDLLTCLEIITEEYSDHSSLDQCAVNIANLRLSELAPLAEFPNWLVKQTQFHLAIVEDAAKFRSQTTLPVHKYKTVLKYKCAAALTSGCERVLVGDAKFPIPRHHGMPAVPDGFFYEQ